MKTNFTLKDLVKYAIFVGVIYALIKIIPSQEIKEKDLVLLVLVITIGFIFVDCYNTEKFTDVTGNIQLNTLTPSIPTMSTATTERESVPTTERESVPTTGSVSMSNNNTHLNDFNELIESRSQINVNNKDIEEEDVLNMQSNDAVIQVLQTNNEKIRYQTASEIAAVNDTTVTSGCGIEMEKLKRQVQTQISTLQQKVKDLQNTSSDVNSKKYIELLMTDLSEHNVINATDIDNINNKIASGLISVDEAIQGLEKLKGSAKYKLKVNQQDKYNELPSDMLQPLGDPALSSWDNQFTLLNTNRWQVPMPRPPVCINTTPCKVCPNELDNYPVNLKDWDNSRKISNTVINKAWANDQMNSQETS